LVCDSRRQKQSSSNPGYRFISEEFSTEDKLAACRQATTATRSDLSAEAVKNISGGLNALLADVFALYDTPAMERHSQSFCC
jgi:hypothetical protein